MSAQTKFQKTYGDSTVNEIGQSILQTSDGGFVIAATRLTSGNWIDALFLIRTNGTGDTLWTRLIKEPTVNYSGSQIVETNDGGFAITGIKGGGITFVPYLLKIDSLGNILWNKSFLWFADERINSIVQTPDGGFLLAGYLYNGNNLVYFIRTNSTGDTLWTKSYKENFYNANVYSLRMAKDGGFIAAGSIQNTNTQDVDAFLFKTDSSGMIEWARGYGDTGYDYAQQVEVTSDSGFVIAAVTYSFGAGNADFFLVKTDASGILEWSKTYGGFSDDRSESVRQTPEGGYLFTGESASFSSGSFDCYMIRTDSAGDTIWTRTANGLQNNEGYSLTLTTDSGFAITGTYLNQFGNNDVYFIRADSAGILGCNDVSSSTTVTTPSVQTSNHHLNFVPSTPSVVSHLLEVVSGCVVEVICAAVKIGEEVYEIPLNIFPNPAQTELIIGNDRLTVNSIMIYDIPGKAVIYSLSNVQRPATIDISNLASGIYIIKMLIGNKEIIRKFIKQ